MKALILNGVLVGSDGLPELEKAATIQLQQAGYTVESIMLREKKIAPCTGCFGCWLASPGICVINDFGRELAREIINSDMVVFLTPVTFGGYSSESKKVMDRMIPLLLPFFEVVKGEVHHKKRYKEYPRIVVLGAMAEKDSEMEEIFDALLKRNALNWPGALSGSVIVDDSVKLLTERVGATLKVGGNRI